MVYLTSVGKFPKKDGHPLSDEMKKPLKGKAGPLELYQRKSSPEELKKVSSRG
jgi:hypothetical protein